MSFTAGYEASLAYAQEVTDVTGYGTVTYNMDLPGTPILVGAANVPGVRTERGSKQGYGIGSPYAVYDGKGTRRYEVNIDAALKNADLLSLCLRGSNGYKDLADLCLYLGESTSTGTKYDRAIRLAKCNTFALALQEGNAQEVRLQAAMVGLFEQTINETVTPTNTQTGLTADGAPYFWSNVITVEIGSLQLRDVIAGINIQGNHNLKPRGYRPGSSDKNPLDLVHYALVPGTFAGKATLTFHERLSDTLRKATADATRWGNLVINMAYQDKAMNITLHNCLLDPDYQNAGDSGENPVQYGCDILFRKITVSNGATDIDGGSGLTG